MPGKINPSQLEILKIVSMQVLGNDKSISLGALLGNLQLNVNKSLIIHNMIQSITILSDAIENFCLYCLKDIKVNQKKITENVNNNLMMATVLNQTLGYDNVSKIVKKSINESISLKQSALELNLLTENEYDGLINLKKMVFPHE